MNPKKIEYLENYYLQGNSIFLLGLSLALIIFVFWASYFKIDEVTRATGEMIASSRVQIIQAVDGGVLSVLNVKEGDIVQVGQVLARLDQTRIQASVGEINTRIFSLKARAIRLRAEVTGATEMIFPESVQPEFSELANVEKALFEQRRNGYIAESKTLLVAVNLAKKELNFINKLRETGDASTLERIRTERSLNDVEAKRISYRHRFLEESRLALVKAEDDIAQNEQRLNRVLQEERDSIFKALVPGVVKNVRVTTVGGVLRAGEELMQIVPVHDDLILEAKVMPSDIAHVTIGQEATIRFDAYDYTIYGGVLGEVVYISADTLKEETNRGTEIYYRVHAKALSQPVVTEIGRSLTILPGMTAQLDIRSGERSLMDYLLKPLKKTLNESFGER